MAPVPTLDAYRVGQRARLFHPHFHAERTGEIVQIVDHGRDTKWDLPLVITVRLDDKTHGGCDGGTGRSPDPIYFPQFAYVTELDQIRPEGRGIQ